MNSSPTEGSFKMIFDGVPYFSTPGGNQFFWGKRYNHYGKLKSLSLVNGQDFDSIDSLRNDNFLILSLLLPIVKVTYKATIVLTTELKDIIQKSI